MVPLKLNNYTKYVFYIVVYYDAYFILFYADHGHFFF